MRSEIAACNASGGRTDPAGAEQIAGWLRAEGWEVRAKGFDEHFLHLGVMFCMAAPGLAVACFDGFPGKFVGLLQGHGIRCLPVPYREALRLGCNVLSLG